MKGLRILLAATLLCAGCSSVGTVGMVTRSTGDPGALLRSGRSYQELGTVEGEACRFFLLNVIPFGDSTFSSAVDKALDESKADALLNVTVSSSLYGFIPIYNIMSYTCTNVRGIAIKFEKQPPPPAS